MSIASQQFNSTIFAKTEADYIAEEYCDEVFLNRKGFTQHVRDLVREFARIPKLVRESDVCYQIRDALAKAEKDLQIKVNLERGTISFIPYKEIYNRVKNENQEV